MPLQMSERNYRFMKETTSFNRWEERWSLLKYFEGFEEGWAIQIWYQFMAWDFKKTNPKTIIETAEIKTADQSDNDITIKLIQN